MITLLIFHFWSLKCLNLYNGETDVFQSFIFSRLLLMRTLFTILMLVSKNLTKSNFPFKMYPGPLIKFVFTQFIFTKLISTIWWTHWILNNSVLIWSWLKNKQKIGRHVNEQRFFNNLNRTVFIFLNNVLLI